MDLSNLLGTPRPCSSTKTSSNLSSPGLSLTLISQETTSLGSMSDRTSGIHDPLGEGSTNCYNWSRADLKTSRNWEMGMSFAHKSTERSRRQGEGPLCLPRAHTLSWEPDCALWFAKVVEARTEKTAAAPGGGLKGNPVRQGDVSTSSPWGPKDRPAAASELQRFILGEHRQLSINSHTHIHV